jgi:acetyl esterase/lipase
LRSIESTAVDKILLGAKDLRALLLPKEEEIMIADMAAANRKQYKLPISVALTMKPQKSKIGKTVCYTFGSGDKCILYLHGGCYCYQPMIFHWRFLQKLQREAGVKIVVPIYPKTPTHSCVEVSNEALLVYKELLKTYDSSNIILMGDSAGGGLSLVLAEVITKKHLPKPKCVITVSPWVDVSMENPEMKEYFTGDVLLGYEELKTWGRCYAASKGVKYYKASPLYGIVPDMPPVYIFVGSSEMFLPDCLRFKHEADKVGVDVKVYEFPSMQHVFLLMPVREAIEARKMVVELLKRDD